MSLVWVETRDAADYLLASIVSYAPYFAVLWLLEYFGMWHLPAAGISWFVSYMLVFFRQTRSRRRTLRLFASYTLFVIMPSGVINDLLLSAFDSSTAMSRPLSVGIAAIAAGFVGYLVSRRVLR
jgi:putative flippase GtrA